MKKKPTSIGVSVLLTRNPCNSAALDTMVSPTDRFYLELLDNYGSKNQLFSTPRKEIIQKREKSIDIIRNIIYNILANNNYHTKERNVMAWEIVKLDEGKKCIGMPHASIGFGRISLNVAACNLIDNYNDYKYVELLTDTNIPSIVGIEFTKESTSTSLAIKRKISNGKTVGGIDIPSKHHVEKLFGINGTQKKTTRYTVTKDKGSNNILIIDLTTK